MSTSLAALGEAGPPPTSDGALPVPAPDTAAGGRMGPRPWGPRCVGSSPAAVLAAVAAAAAAVMSANVGWASSCSSTSTSSVPAAPHKDRVAGMRCNARLAGHLSLLMHTRFNVEGVHSKPPKPTAHNGHCWPHSTLPPSSRPERTCSTLTPCSSCTGGGSAAGRCQSAVTRRFMASRVLVSRA